MASNRLQIGTAGDVPDSIPVAADRILRTGYSWTVFHLGRPWRDSIRLLCQDAPVAIRWRQRWHETLGSHFTVIVKQEGLSRGGVRRRDWRRIFFFFGQDVRPSPVVVKAGEQRRRATIADVPCRQYTPVGAGKSRCRSHTGCGMWAIPSHRDRHAVARFRNAAARLVRHSCRATSRACKQLTAMQFGKFGGGIDSELTAAS